MPLAATLNCAPLIETRLRERPFEAGGNPQNLTRLDKVPTPAV